MNPQFPDSFTRLACNCIQLEYRAGWDTKDRNEAALKESLGLPKVMKSISVESLRALFKMFKNKEI